MEKLKEEKEKELAEANGNEETKEEESSSFKKPEDTLPETEEEFKEFAELNEEKSISELLTPE